MLDRLSKISAYTFCAMAFGVQAVFAADPLGGPAVHDIEHAEAGGGLPQFNIDTFPTQLFWLAITFVVMYAVFSSRILPDISGILENRRVHIESDLETADRLRKEADGVQAAYEANLDHARNESKRLVNDVHATMKSRTEAQMNSLRQKAEHDMTALEARLGNAKAEAMEQMTTIAAEVASEAAAKIVGTPADLDSARSVVQSINKREAA